MKESSVIFKKNVDFLQFEECKVNRQAYFFPIRIDEFQKKRKVGVSGILQVPSNNQGVYLS